MANAEIERLRALLESQETLTSETETLSPDGLVGVLQALSQHLSRVDDAPAIRTKSAKIPDVMNSINIRKGAHHAWSKARSIGSSKYKNLKLGKEAKWC